MLRICIHKIGSKCCIKSLLAERQQGGTNINDKPEEMVLSCPAVKKYTRWRKNARQQERVAEFGRRIVPSAGFHFLWSMSDPHS